MVLLPRIEHPAGQTGGDLRELYCCKGSRSSVSSYSEPLGAKVDTLCITALCSLVIASRLIEFASSKEKSYCANLLQIGQGLGIFTHHKLICVKHNLRSLRLLPRVKAVLRVHESNARDSEIRIGSEVIDVCFLSCKPRPVDCYNLIVMVWTIPTVGYI
jgi:hypothetical protein